MSWVMSGSCAHCGVCCLHEDLGGFMRENPCISLGEDRCKFYTDDVDTGTRYGHCRIKQVSDNYNRVRDKNGDRMTDAQIAWYEHNCRLWPARVKDIQALRDGLWELPATCGFSIEWVE